MSIFLDNDWEYEVNITRKDTATGTVEAAAGLSGITGRISLTPTGLTIHADLTKTLAERASTPGEYFAIVEKEVAWEGITTFSSPCWATGPNNTRSTQRGYNTDPHRGSLVEQVVEQEWFTAASLDFARGVGA